MDEREQLIADLRALVRAAADEGTWYAREHQIVEVLDRLDGLDKPSTSDVATS